MGNKNCNITWHLAAFKINKKYQVVDCGFQNTKEAPAVSWNHNYHFYTPWKRQNTNGFLTFSGVQKKNIGLNKLKGINLFSIIIIIIIINLFCFGIKT